MSWPSLELTIERAKVIGRPAKILMSKEAMQHFLGRDISEPRGYRVGLLGLEVLTYEQAGIDWGDHPVPLFVIQSYSFGG